MAVVPFRWRSGTLEVLDQRRLPHTIRWIACRTPRQVADTIRVMAVRGAPAIGCVAAFGMALASRPSSNGQSLPMLESAGKMLKAARPTAVNLAWGVDRMMDKAKQFYHSRESGNPSGWAPASAGATMPSMLLAEAKAIASEDVANNRAMGRHGARLLRKRSIILTHCNAGALATAGHGTALGVIREAFDQGKVAHVFVDETRPWFQGARLTAWELSLAKIPHEIITDSMAAHMMKTEKISTVIVGCDRVAANGDTANKIGTYGLAVLAKHHGVPFYVAMPTSSLDRGLKTGAGIPIENRSSDEVVRVGGVRLAPHDTTARHPAFDVTPASLITAIITEKGVARPPFVDSLQRLS